MASIILFGLESDLADQLSRILRLDGHRVHTSSFFDAAPQGDILFVGGDGPDYRETVRNLLHRRPETPVVIVNRVPDNTRWLDALELGASDYCGAPFETTQVRWLVDAVRGYGRPRLCQASASSPAGGPNTTQSRADFGRITGTGNSRRSVELGARLSF